MDIQKNQQLAGLIAGTVVHTKNGLLPIEEIKVGDQVLSPGKDGGKLAYRPVTKILTREDAVIWVVKYSTTDPATEDPEELTNSLTYHLYVTGDLSFSVVERGAKSAEVLQGGWRLARAYPSAAWADIVWPVIRTPLPGVGWVPADVMGRHDGMEWAHIVDFRRGADLWHYRWFGEAKAGVPYRQGLSYDDIPNYFSGAAMADLFYGKDEGYFDGRFRYRHTRNLEDEFGTHTDDERLFRARVHTLQVEASAGFYVGEPGIFILSPLCEASL
jgi:hypothetical protein